MPELRDILARYDLKVLQAMARELNVRLDARSPKDAARILERYIGASETVRRTWERLRAQEREVLTRLQQAGGRVFTR